MRNARSLGKLFDIPVGFHWSGWLLAGLVTLVLSGTVLPATAAGYGGAAYLAVGMLMAVALLGSIVAHEFGHALVARREGVGTADITLMALGGVARLTDEPRTAGAAARIALAGPAVSLVIGIGGLVAALAAGFIGLPALAVAALGWLGLANLVMAVFNMLPALPLDGGRVLQAALWHRRGDADTATISAAKVGRYLGWALVAFGAWQLFQGANGLWTMLIGWFVVTTASAEAARARFRVMSRNWAPPVWFPGSPWGPQGPGRRSEGFGPGFGPGAGFGPQPGFGPGFGPGAGGGRPDRSGDVIDVDGQPVG